MTDEQKAAYINSQTILLHATIAGMVAKNYDRMLRGAPLAYTELDFQKAIAKSGVNPNEVIDLFIHQQ